MKKSRFSEAQIATALRQVDAGAPIPEVTRALGISEATSYVWRKRYGQMAIAEIRRLRQLEEETRKLKQVVADLTLDKGILQEVLAKSPEAHAQACPRPGGASASFHRGATGLWAAPIESSLVVLPPSSPGGYGAAEAVTRTGPSAAAVWLSAPACAAAPGGLASKQEAGASSLSGRRAGRAAHPPPETGESSPGDAAVPEPDERTVEYGFCGGYVLGWTAVSSAHRRG